MLTQQEIDQHNARVQADWQATREQREAEQVADIERRWNELGYTDNPPIEEKAKWLRSISYEPPTETGDDYEANLMALPGTARHTNLHYGEWKIYNWQGRIVAQGGGRQRV